MSLPILSKKEDDGNRTTSKCYVLIWTLIYTVLCPFFFYIALLSGMLLENPNTTVPIGLCMIFAMFWIPLSMPVSIYQMWSNFSHGNYKRTFYWGGLPIVTTIVVFLLVDGILPLL